MNLRRSAAATAGLMLLWGCAAVPEAGTRPGRAEPPPREIPAGLGTLRPDDLTIDLVEGPLRIELTPLSEPFLRLLVPDAADRLREIARLGGRAPNATPFLVSFYTETQGLRFEQSDLTLESGGRVHRAVRVVGATQGWGTGLLRQREPASAVYLFEGVDLEREFTASYRTARSSEWATILPVVDAERGRVRGRGGDRAPRRYSSSPNFRILR